MVTGVHVAAVVVVDDIPVTFQKKTASFFTVSLKRALDIAVGNAWKYALGLGAWSHIENKLETFFQHLLQHLFAS